MYLFFSIDPLAMVMRMSGPLFAFHQISKDIIDHPDDRYLFKLNKRENNI